MDYMPSFDRSVLTSAIRATTSCEEDPDGSTMDQTDLFIRRSLQGGTDDSDAARKKSTRGMLADAGLNAVTSLARESITSVVPAPTRNSYAEGVRFGMQADLYDARDVPVSIRDQLPTLRKSLAKQIREDTAQRINNITIAMWSNENKLDAAIKRQYDEEAERSRLGLPRETGTVGGTMFYDSLHERFG
jgi:hypothetical protein